MFTLSASSASQNEGTLSLLSFAVHPVEGTSVLWNAKTCLRDMIIDATNQVHTLL